MPTYVVERILPAASIEALGAIRDAAETACHASVLDGKPIHYLRSILTPGESRCRCLFEAPNGDLVREVNDAAQLPYTRIVLAMELSAAQPSDRPP